jgi:hypothetical protein
MTKLLIANGCSHTAGSEIDPNNLKVCFEKAWPRWVAEHYGMDYLNLAQGGNGNEQISRTTTITISKLLHAGKDPKDILVAVLWSGFDRYEYWDPDKQIHKSFSYNTHRSPYSPKEPVSSYIKFRSLVEPENYSNYKNLYYVWQLSVFLSSLGIKYYFGNALQNFIPLPLFKASDNLIKEYSELLELYSDNIERHVGFFDRSKLFVYHLVDVPKSKLGLGTHWGEEGQRKYAEFFIKNMGV